MSINKSTITKKITGTKMSADDRNLFISAAKLAEEQRARQVSDQDIRAAGASHHPKRSPIDATRAKIKVVGVGGGGTNAINTMISSGLDSVDFVAANTDTQSLNHSLSPVTIQIGKELTRGLGAGADPDIGRDATLEDRHEIMEALTGSDMVFVTAGMGGGTGTGGASVVAQIARELGALTVGVVTKPFTFEGRRRSKQAEIGIERLREAVDTLIVIPNQKLLQMATPEMSLLEAFKLADKVLLDAVRGISDIINIPGTINVDFADVKTIMSKMGRALMGIGFAEGEGRAMTAASMAISSPLLEDMHIEGATGVLINITAAPSVGILELNEACSVIHESAHEDANIIMGTVIDENLTDGIRVTVIATGFAINHEQHYDPQQTMFAPPPKKILTNIRQEMNSASPHDPAHTPYAHPQQQTHSTPPQNNIPTPPPPVSPSPQSNTPTSTAPRPSAQASSPNPSSAPSAPPPSAAKPAHLSSTPQKPQPPITKPDLTTRHQGAQPISSSSSPQQQLDDHVVSDIERSIDHAMQKATSTSSPHSPHSPGDDSSLRPTQNTKLAHQSSTVDIEVPTYLRKTQHGSDSPSSETGFRAKPS